MMISTQEELQRDCMTAPYIERDEAAMAAEISRLVETKNFDAIGTVDWSARIAACNNTHSDVAIAIEEEAVGVGGRA
jgi:hypothetical protein